MMPLPFFLLIIMLSGKINRQVAYYDAVDECLDEYDSGDLILSDLGYCVVSWDEVNV